MTDKQKIFCNEYLIDLNATQAAIRAGYSKKTARFIATENLTKPYIKEYIEKRLKEKEDALIAKQDEVLQTLTRILRREEKETVVVPLKERKSYYDDKGKKVIEDVEMAKLVEIPTKVSDVNNAADKLGRYYSLFTDKTQIETSGVVQIINDIPKDGDCDG